MSMFIGYAVTRLPGQLPEGWLIVKLNGDRWRIIGAGFGFI
jgi:hypothetical protein